MHPPQIFIFYFYFFQQYRWPSHVASSKTLYLWDPGLLSHHHHHHHYLRALVCLLPLLQLSSRRRHHHFIILAEAMDRQLMLFACFLLLVSSTQAIGVKYCGQCRLLQISVFVSSLSFSIWLHFAVSFEVLSSGFTLIEVFCLQIRRKTTL